METENSVDKEKYKACIDDIEVAKTEIKNMKYTQRMYIFQEDGLYLDGVVQGIRAFGDNPKAVSKEVFYRDAAKINGLSTKQREFFENFYLKIEEIIEGRE